MTVNNWQSKKERSAYGHPVDVVWVAGTVRV